MCSPSPPPAPDVIGAANAQGAANVQTALTQGRINNPNIIGPGSSRTVSWGASGQQGPPPDRPSGTPQSNPQAWNAYAADLTAWNDSKPANDTPTITTTLSPQEQAIYDQNVATRGALAQLGTQGAGSLRGIVGTPLDPSGLPASPDAYRASGAQPTPLDARGLPRMPSTYTAPTNLPAMPQGSEALRQQVIDAMMTRSNTDLAKRTDQTRSDLIAQGIRPGTEAYTREMDQIDRARNDARTQAEANAGAEVARQYGMDLSSRQEGQQEALANSAQSFGQGMQQRGAAVGEQGQTFQQTGQTAQLQASQQAQQYQQQADARRTAIAEALTRRQVPLNEIIGLMSGSQVSNPFSGSGTTGGNGGGGFNGVNVAPPPIFGANQQANQYQTDVYNQQVSTSNANTQAGAAVAAAAIAAMF
jgi:hypothetical protein